MEKEPEVTYMTPIDGVGFVLMDEVADNGDISEKKFALVVEAEGSDYYYSFEDDEEIASFLGGIASVVKSAKIEYGGTIPEWMMADFEGEFDD